MKALQCESAKPPPKDMHKGKGRGEKDESVKHERNEERGRERKDKSVRLSAPQAPRQDSVAARSRSKWWSQTRSVGW